MKRLGFFLTLITMSSVLSCSGDDDNTNPTGSGVAGTYNLTSVAITEPVDFNGDGVASANLMTESNCYAGSFIKINNDGTYNLTSNYVVLESDSGCFSEQASGTWVRDGEEMTLTNTMMEPSSTSDYVYLEGALIETLPNAPYPTRDAEGNEVYANGLVTLTYTKAE